MQTERAFVARRALGLVDLTNLDDVVTAADIRALCARASSPHGSVAAVCVWPRFVTIAKRTLLNTAVRVATVTNFPSGAERLEDVVAQTRAALADGADEIDVVLPYRAFASGDTATAVGLLDAVRREVPSDGMHVLKVILETGELGDEALIGAASRAAIEHGADFIKTSTGKTTVSATLDATAVMLAVIRDTDRRIGLKPSGGIRTLADAAAYLDQADATMGETWVSPYTFRFGASGLLSALTNELDNALDNANGDMIAPKTPETDY